MKAYAVPFEKFVNLADARLGTKITVSYTHLTLPTIYSV